MGLEIAAIGRLRLVRTALLSSLVLVGPAQQPAAGQVRQGEIVDVRIGFARVALKRGAGAPRATGVQVTWKGHTQPVREVLGGPGSPIEVGIAIDISASMARSLDAMKIAVSTFLQEELSTADRVFVATISDESKLVGEGLDGSLDAIAGLSIDGRPGVRPTKFYAGLEQTLRRFRNSSPRAVLVVASDGCDSIREPGAVERVLGEASTLSIPIVLIAPSRQACLNTICKPSGSGEWNCSESASSRPPTHRTRIWQTANPTGDYGNASNGFPGSTATGLRDHFLRQLRGHGGISLIARSGRDWKRGVDAVRSLLDRQWMVVFEPTSREVRSSEVKVKVAARAESGG